ncbi:MAG: rRNA maturation RNase YbeY [Cyclobacteriaceae bacterium]
MGSIRFFSEDTDFSLQHPRKTSAWIKKVITKERKHLSEVNYIFCTDKYLLNLNKDFLRHNTLTDIITFDNSTQKGIIEAEIYISIERVLDNADKFKVRFDEELHRVIIHGVLHLMGYKDKKPAEVAQMRKKEEACLSLRK